MNKERKYFVFDIDDNIVKTDTPLHMEQLINNEWVSVVVSSEEYSKVRSLDNYRHIPNSYIEFRDFGERGNDAFLFDFQTAVNNGRLAPSFDKYKYCLMKGYLFAFITARGHEIDSFKKAVMWFISNKLTKVEINIMVFNLRQFYPNCSIPDMFNQYLNDCRYYATSNESFISTYCNDIVEYKTELGKVRALIDFTEYLKKFTSDTINIGFSDDDSENLLKLEAYMKSHTFDNVRYYLIDTSNNGYKKREILVEN